MKIAGLCAALIFVGCARASSQEAIRVSQGSKSDFKTTPGGSLPVRFRATVYEVRLPNSKLPELDAVRLAEQGKTPAELQKALAMFGKNKVLHHVDQGIDLKEGGLIETAIMTPYAEATFVPNTTVVNAGIKFISRGMTVKVKGGWSGDKDQARIKVALEASVSVDEMSDLKLTEGVETKIPASKTIKFMSTSLVNPGSPAILVAAEGESATTEGEASAAYVVWFTVTPQE